MDNKTLKGMMIRVTMTIGSIRKITFIGGFSDDFRDKWDKLPPYMQAYYVKIAELVEQTITSDEWAILNGPENFPPAHRRDGNV